MQASQTNGVTKPDPRKTRAAKPLGARGADRTPLIPHQPEGDTGKPGAAATGRVTMNRVNLGDNRVFPPMQGNAATS